MRVYKTTEFCRVATGKPLLAFVVAVQVTVNCTEIKRSWNVLKI